MKRLSCFLLVFVAMVFVGAKKKQQTKPGSITIQALYVLSYAPYLAYRYENPTPVTIGAFGPHYDQDDEYFSNNTHTFYQPVEYLIDHTLFEKPLLLWADLWNVRKKTEHDSLFRWMNCPQFRKR